MFLLEDKAELATTHSQGALNLQINYFGAFIAALLDRRWDIASARDSTQREHAFWGCAIKVSPHPMAEQGFARLHCG